MDVSEDLVLMYFFLIFCISWVYGVVVFFVVGWFCLFSPPNNKILQQRSFFSPILEEMENKKDFSHPPEVSSPLLLRAPCGPNSISTHCITSLFLRLMSLLSCLWLIMPWIFITGSAFWNFYCLECFQLDPSSLVLQFATVPVRAAAVQ